MSESVGVINAFWHIGRRRHRTRDTLPAKFAWRATSIHGRSVCHAICGLFVCSRRIVFVVVLCTKWRYYWTYVRAFIMRVRSQTWVALTVSTNHQYNQSCNRHANKTTSKHEVSQKCVKCTNRTNRTSEYVAPPTPSCRSKFK